MKLIENWKNRPLRCFFCGSSHSVKYEVDHDGKTVYACDKCAERNDLARLLKNIANEWDDYIFFCREEEKLPKLSHDEFYAKAILDAGHRKQSDLTPCDVCQYNPPSSGDGKPCSVCPAQAKMKEGAE